MELDQYTLNHAKDQALKHKHEVILAFNAIFEQIIRPEYINNRDLDIIMRYFVDKLVEDYTGVLHLESFNNSMKNTLEFRVDTTPEKTISLFQSTKKTTWYNFSKDLEPEEAQQKMKFVLKSLNTTGAFNSKGDLIIRGRYNFLQLSNLDKKYNSKTVL